MSRSPLMVGVCAFFQIFWQNEVKFVFVSQCVVIRRCRTKYHLTEVRQLRRLRSPPIVKNGLDVCLTELETEAPEQPSQQLAPTAA